MPDITDADIDAYLTSQNDFDLELFVYRQFNEHGWDARHGGAYTDRITGKARQFDIRATKCRGVAVGRALVLRFAVECKALTKECPLLVSCVPRTDRKSTRLNSSHLGISYAVF